MFDIRHAVEKLLCDHMENEGTTPKCAIQDVLVQLMNASGISGYDFDTILSGAEQVYQKEVELDENAGV